MGYIKRHPHHGTENALGVAKGVLPNLGYVKTEQRMCLICKQPIPFFRRSGRVSKSPICEKTDCVQKYKYILADRRQPRVKPKVWRGVKRKRY